MSVARVAVSIDERVLRRLDSLVKARVFRTRSEAVQSAVQRQLARTNRARLARECAKLDPHQEAKLADEGLATDFKEWPAY
jgi:metal-responsive CopG/Arc/MetJ family transcriptional regulator